MVVGERCIVLVWMMAAEFFCFSTPITRTCYFRVYYDKTSQHVGTFREHYTCYMCVLNFPANLKSVDF